MCVKLPPFLTEEVQIKSSYIELIDKINQIVRQGIKPTSVAQDATLNDKINQGVSDVDPPPASLRSGPGEPCDVFYVWEVEVYFYTKQKSSWKVKGPS